MNLCTTEPLVSGQKAYNSQSGLRLDASFSSNCSKSVDFIKSRQVCENQTRCNLMFSDLLQVVETTCIKLVDKKS